MRLGLSILLTVSVLMSVACSDERTRELNRGSKRLIDGAKNSKRTLNEKIANLKNAELPEAPSLPTKEGMKETGEAVVDSISTATAEKVTEKMSKNLDAKVDSAERLYGDTSRSVERTGESARSTIRWIARKTPRSQREANQLTYSVGRKWMLEFRAYLDSIAKRGAFRVDRRRADQKRAEK